MAIKTYKPYTASRRNMTGSAFTEITKSEPEKSLVVRVKNTAGRNSYGKITVRHMGGGHKKLYRIIDFKRNKDGIPAKVTGIEYDPNRSANIALLTYADGEKRYILAPEGLTDGDTVISDHDINILAGIEPSGNHYVYASGKGTSDGLECLAAHDYRRTKGLASEETHVFGNMPQEVVVLSNGIVIGYCYYDTFFHEFGVLGWPA